MLVASATAAFWWLPV